MYAQRNMRISTPDDEIHLDLELSSFDLVWHWPNHISVSAKISRVKTKYVVDDLLLVHFKAEEENISMS